MQKNTLKIKSGFILFDRINYSKPPLFISTNSRCPTVKQMFKFSSTKKAQRWAGFSV